jgi:hypothetical protein
MTRTQGREQSREYLMTLWRRYMEQSANNEGDVEAQIVVAAYHAAEVLGFLSATLDREGRLRALIDERLAQFGEGSRRAEGFGNCLVNATFSLYNHLNTLSHQFAKGSASAGNLIREVDDRVRAQIQQAGQIERSAFALRAAFPLLGLITLVLGAGTNLIPAIRKVEERFAAGTNRAGTEWEHLLNALYRLVEMMQLFVALSDAGLQDQVQHIAASFKDEDSVLDLHLKLRNGFSRFFELGYLLTSHVSQTIPE